VESELSSCGEVKCVSSTVAPPGWRDSKLGVAVDGLAKGAESADKKVASNKSSSTATPLFS
jgi:hypothetical protein